MQRRGKLGSILEVVYFAFYSISASEQGVKSTHLRVHIFSITSKIFLATLAKFVITSRFVNRTTFIPQDSK